MSRDQHGPVRIFIHVFFQLPKQVALTLDIHRAGWFIENQQFRFLHQCSGNSDRLTLASGKRLAALSNRLIDTSWKCPDKIGQSNAVESFEHHLIGNPGATGLQVGTKAAIQESRILRNIAHVIAKLSGVQLPNIDARQINPPIARFIKSHQHSQKRTFP